MATLTLVPPPAPDPEPGTGVAKAARLLLAIGITPESVRQPSPRSPRLRALADAMEALLSS